MGIHKKVRNATAEELVEMVFNGEVSYAPSLPPCFSPRRDPHHPRPTETTGRFRPAAGH